MRQYVVDEIRKTDMERVRAYLTERARPSGMTEIFWLELPADLLGPVQWEHRECGPYYLAIEVGRDFVKFELLVRARNKFRCDCIQFANPAQESFLLKFAHTLIADLELQT